MMNCGKILLLLMVACFGLAACQNSPALDAQAQTADAAPELSVMSFNLRYANTADGDNAWTHRKDDVLALLDGYQPDVLGVQEATPVQMQELQDGLPGYANLGVGRDADNQGEFSAIFYAKDKLQLLEGDTFWLSETPDVPSKGWDAALNRICTWGKFRVQASGREFLAFNTHFDHVGVEARQQAARLILQKIEELNPQRLPVVLSGDFNLTENEAPIGLISAAMQDGFYHARGGHQGPTGTFQDFRTDITEPERIDYIFTTGVAVLTHTHLDERRRSDPARYPSDHFPVLAELKLSPLPE